MPEHGRHDVLIVGLGPVLAALCAKLGLRVRAVEKDTAIYRLPQRVPRRKPGRPRKAS